MSSPLLAARGLGFSYRTGEAIIEGLDCEFAPGSMVALTGASGSGKSTLLYLLGLMVRPSAGQVLLDGAPVHDLRESRRAALRASVFGFVFQDAVLDPTRTVMDNVTETALYRGQDRSAARERAGELMERFGVAARAGHKPGQISGGQAQRIALCRALLADPPVLLADEPTGNLDPDSAATVVRAFREHAQAGACVVIATHAAGLAASCDQLIRL